MAEAAAEGGPKKPSQILKYLKLIFIGLNVIVSLGGIGLVYMSTVGYEAPSLSEEKLLIELENEKKARPSQAAVYTMEKFTVNLDGLPKRVIQAELNLEMLDQEGFEEVVRLGPQARDAIVRLFNGKRYDELETIQGKLILKDQIATTLNAFLTEGVVKDIYFSEFVVQ